MFRTAQRPSILSGKNENLHNGLEIAEVATWILRLVTAFQKGKEAGHYRLY